MAKADLHVHSKYSDHPSTWGHKVYNSPESFTEVETVYHQAKKRGMDFVTLTDHDDIRGSLELVQRFPNDTFMSCEVTTFFPEDGCKAHILVYGISEPQYQTLMQIRFDIYDLRDFIMSEKIAYSVAHATYDQDGKLSFKHIEKLVLLFDVFEIINGGSSSQNNLLLHRYLQHLDQASVEQLISKHGITPNCDDPWVKGFTGGSDDHCGILIGSAFTQAEARNVEEYLLALQQRNCLGNGMHGSFESYATGVIKHIHDYRLNRDAKYANTKMNDFFELFFNGNEGNLVKRFKKSQSLRYLKKKNGKTHAALHALLQQIGENTNQDISAKIPSAYIQISELHDEMFKSIISALAKHLPNGDLLKGFQKLATLFPMTILAAPFLGSMRHQLLRSEIKKNLIQGTRQQYTEKALWFTDTIDDLNGVSVTLRQIAKHSATHNYQLKLVTCVDVNSLSSPLPNNTLNLSPIKEINVPGYEQQKLAFPSMLSMIRKISLEQPDQIIISTPGPLGLGAMLCAKLMDIPVKTVYHTDFAEQTIRITNEPTLASWVDTAINAFYKQSDQVFVPSNAYITKLMAAGLDKEKLTLFPRGLDLDLYCPAPDMEKMTRRHQLHGSFTLLFAGRISEDKNLSLLTKLAHELNNEQTAEYNFVFAGDGPDLQQFESSLSGISNIHFTGRLSPEELVDWYRSADCFVFPSHTDTFGMVILEAQACGVPCIVTNSGGPKEIIKPNETGVVMDSDDTSEWAKAIQSYRSIKLETPETFAMLRKACRNHVSQQNNWQPVFDAVLGTACKLPNEALPNGPVTPINPNSTNTTQPKAA